MGNSKEAKTIHTTSRFSVFPPFPFSLLPHVGTPSRISSHVTANCRADSDRNLRLLKIGDYCMPAEPAERNQISGLRKNGK